MKTCPGCGNKKRSSDFAKNNAKKDGRQDYCRLCKKGYDARHYRENKEAQLARNRINRKKLKDDIDRYKAEAGCVCCPENDPCCLDFHHTNKNKEGSISAMMGNKSKKVLFSEIRKCVVVCANCHRKIHAGKLKIGVVAERLCSRLLPENKKVQLLSAPLTSNF